MAKYYGNIGFITSIETSPGIWEEQIIDRPYFGDIKKYNSNFQSSNKINDDISISNIVSIISDPYANENFQHMRYVEFMGVKWSITNVSILYPRIELNLGGVYNA